MTSPQHEPTIREVLGSIENLGKPRKPSPLETAIIVALGITSSVYLWILGISGINRPALYLLGPLIILWGLVSSMTLLIEARHPDEQSRMLSSTTDRPRHG